MKPDVHVQLNETRNRFEVALADGEFAYLDYRWHNGELALMHTLVPEAFEGQGLASALTAKAFDYARQNGVQVLVYCPFVATYVKRHPEVAGLVSRQYQP